jgi:hypothetical protein
MKLPAVFDSVWFDLGLGVAMIVFGVLQAFKRTGRVGWASAIVFILWGMFLLYHGIFGIPNR